MSSAEIDHDSSTEDGDSPDPDPHQSRLRLNQDIKQQDLKKRSGKCSLKAVPSRYLWQQDVQRAAEKFSDLLTRLQEGEWQPLDAALECRGGDCFAVVRLSEGTETLVQEYVAGRKDLILPNPQEPFVTRDFEEVAVLLLDRVSSGGRLLRQAADAFFLNLDPLVRAELGFGAVFRDVSVDRGQPDEVRCDEDFGYYRDRRVVDGRQTYLVLNASDLRQELLSPQNRRFIA